MTRPRLKKRRRGGTQVYPVLLPFPIWRYGERVNIFGDRLTDGWYPDPYGIREVPKPKETPR